MFKVTTLNGTNPIDTETITDIEDMNVTRKNREKVAAHFAVNNTPFTIPVGHGYSIRVERA